MTAASIIALVFSAIISGAGIYEQSRVNKQNVQMAVENREDEQQFQHDEAALARQANVEQFNELYSPLAKRQQFEEAGLSPGLMYSEGAAGGIGGVTTQQAMGGSHAAPYINPLLNLAQANPVTQALQNMQTTEDTKKVKAQTREINQNIEESRSRVKKIEQEINQSIVTTENEKLRKKLIENEIEISNATMDDVIKTAKKNVELIDENINKVKKEIDILNIEESKKAEYLEASIELMQEEKKKYAAETVLKYAEAELARAKAKLTEKQEELTKEQIRQIKQEIEKNEIELTKLRRNPLWGEKGTDRITGLAMSFGESFADAKRWIFKQLGDVEKNVGKWTHETFDKWWKENGENLEEMWHGNWVPLIDNFIR